MSTQIAVADPAVGASLTLLQALTSSYEPRDFAVRLWDGTSWEPEAGQSTKFTLVLHHPGALRAMFWPPHRSRLAEAYIYDDLDIEGDIHAFFRLIRHLLAQHWSVADRLRLAVRLWSLPSTTRPHTGRQPAHLHGRKRSLARDREAISYHYDLSNDFFATWLDRRMVYSCAYFTDASDDLDAAQEHKLDHVCRKLRLRAGERLLDIGCGWGGLAIHAAQRYGVHVLGITLSQRQAEEANERIRRAGLTDRCKVAYQDYREIDGSQSFDKIASIGMVEHLGEAMLPIFYQAAWRSLRPGGAFLNHGITLNARTGYPRWTRFARQYVFPDGEIRPLISYLHAAEAVGFEVRDVESLREHYVLTLQHWVKRLEAHHDEARQLTDEVTYRIFRLYLAGARQGFLSGSYNLHQTLLVKPADGQSGLPLTRSDWYA
jgi:cyclopropane-fatty-acyl-phospholipid synthase